MKKSLQFHLDNLGCSKHCTVLAESMQESHFMIGRNDVNLVTLKLVNLII